MPARTFYTVGHSTHTIDGFVALLRAARVNQIADVRAMPRSRTNPQFNRDFLAAALVAFGITYSHVAALAGLQPRSRTVANGVNGCWRNRSFHNYADYALSASFRQGLVQLIELGRRRTCAIMCSEAVWWRCHRRIITDHLIHRGWTVYHLMSKGRIRPAIMTEFARITGDGDIIYPIRDTQTE